MGLIYDGHDFGDLVEYGDPEYTQLTSNVHYASSENRDGDIVLGKTWGVARLAFRIGVNGTIAQRRDILSTIASWLDVDEPKKLVVPDMPGRYFMAIPDGDVPTIRGYDGEIATLAFALTDPIAYGDETTVTVPSGGSATFHVGGTSTARPIITANATRDASALVWGLRLDEQNFVHVATGSSSSRSVAIDCLERTCIVNSSVKMITLDSDWLELKPGKHTLRMDYGTGAATVRYIERWL